MKKENLMEHVPFVLKVVFTCIAILFPMMGKGKEITVTTQQGESFIFHADPHTTLEEVAEQVNQLSQVGDNAIVLIEMGLGQDHTAQPIAWGWQVKRHGQYLGYARDYYADLSQVERNDIRYIITFLANKSLISIASHKGTLEEKGDRIDHVHPMKFLLTVFGDEELKVGIRNIRAKGWVWGDFIAGLKESLATEASIQNIMDEHIQHFAQSLGLEYGLIAPSVYARRWDEFIDLLIVHVPRKGDYNRYDS